MNTSTADVVICGAGICGISAAYHLAIKQGIKKVILVDEREPMSFTSDKSTECYRNWWPGPGDAMNRFMNRSIDLLEDLAEESNNYFGLQRRGYVFLTSRPERARELEQTAREICDLGAGPLRIHAGREADPVYEPWPVEGYKGQPTGADLVLNPAIIRQKFPFVNESAIAMLHPRRCGWLSAQQWAAYMLEQGKRQGVELLRGRVTGVSVEKNRIRSVWAETDQGQVEIQTEKYVIAAGPFLKQAGAMLGIDLPVQNELHAKFSFSDPLKAIPRHVPLMLWDDPVHLAWTEEERRELATDETARWLLGQFPSGVHFRPEGREDSPIILSIWTYDIRTQEPVPNPKFEPEHGEVILRGLANMVPGLSAYFGRLYSPVVDGGYYCKTQENRPLIGPLPVEGAFIFGAVSGFGVMGGMAGGELLAQHVAGASLPDYAPAFLLTRYEDPAYQKLLADWSALSGQL
jgi:glycine/D-amino acid oxidase-like deaminating enzyme